MIKINAFAELLINLPKILILLVSPNHYPITAIHPGWYWANLPANQIQPVILMESHPKRPRLRQSIEESKLEAILNSAVAAIITIDT